MRKIVNFIILILAFFVGVSWAAGTIETLYSDENAYLYEGQSQESTFVVEQLDGEIYLWLTVRLKINGGESWGSHLLSLRINDQLVDMAAGPINREGEIKNVAYPNNNPEPVFKDGKWFVRYDSDYIAWNGKVPAQAGDPYNKVSYLYRANELINKEDFVQQNYVYTFRIGHLLKQGVNKIQLSCSGLPDFLQDYPLEIKQLSIAQQQGNVVLWSRDFMDAIYPWSVPMPKEVARPLNVRLSQNEYEPVTFACFSPVALDDITVEVGSLVGAGSVFPQDQIRLQLVEYKKWTAQNTPERYKMLSQMQAGLGAARQGITPQMLVSISEFDLPGGESRQIWLTVNSDGVKAGLYQGSISLRRRGQQLASLPISIEVLPITLPESPVRFGAWFTERPGTPMVTAQLQDLKEHGYSFVSVDCYTATPQLALERGELTIDYSSFDAVIEGYQKEGLNLGPMMFGILTPLIKQIENISGAKLGEEAFDNLFVKTICDINKHALAKGWDLYFAPIDEPHPYPDKMEQEQQYLALLKRAGAKSFSTITPAGAYTLSPNLDLSCIGYNFLEEALSGKPKQDLYWEDVEPQWVIDNTKWIYKQIRSFPFDRYYHGYMAYRFGVEALMGFAYNWTSQDWYVVRVEGNELKGSVGWESIREGIDDLRYVELLRQIWTQQYGEAEAKAKLDELLQPVLTTSWDEPEYQEYSKMKALLQDKILAELSK